MGFEAIMTSIGLLTKAISYVGNTIAFGVKVFTGPFVKFSGIMKQYIEKADELNKAVSQFGTSVNAIKSAFDTNLNNYSNSLASNSEILSQKFGTLAGINEELTNALEILEVGLDIQNTQLQKLTLENRVAGVNNKNLLKVLRQSVLTGNLTNATLGTFTEKIGEFRDTFNISVNSLVDAMSELSDDLDLAFYGVGQQFSEAAMLAESIYGQGTAKLFDRLSKEVMNPDFYGAGMLFGIDQLTRNLMDPSVNAEKVLESQLKIVRRLDSQLGEFQKSFTALGVPANVAKQRLSAFGVSDELITLTRALAKLTPKTLLELKEKQDPFANIKTELDKITIPFQRLGYKMLPMVLEFIKMIGQLFKTLKLEEIFNRWGIAFDYTVFRLKKFTALLMDAEGNLTPGFQALVDSLKTTGIRFVGFVDSLFDFLDTRADELAYAISWVVDAFNALIIIASSVSFMFDTMKKAGDQFRSVQKELITLPLTIMQKVFDILGIFSDTAEAISEQIEKLKEFVTSPSQWFDFIAGKRLERVDEHYKFLADKMQEANKKNEDMKNAIVGAQNATTQAVNTNTAIAKAALNDQQRKELEERRRRMVEQAQDSLNYRTNTYLEMQSKSLDATMQEIMFGNDLMSKLVGINREQLSSMLSLLDQAKKNGRPTVAAPTPP